MDLRIIDNGNGGDLVQVGNDLEVIEGLQNMAYLAMFGGNTEANTPVVREPSEQALDWWANSLLFPNEPGIQFNSDTERTLVNVALTSAGRILIEQAVKRDLEFMKSFAVVTPSVTIESDNRVSILIEIQQPGNIDVKSFQFIWDSTKQELIA